MNEVAVVAASEDDVRAIARRRGFNEAGFRLTLELAERGTVWVARDDGEVVGIAIAHASEQERYVGDLFVEPSYRGQGIGRRLLEAAFTDADDVTRAVLFDPADSAAYALAVGFGLSPGGTLARMAGAIPREEELARMAAGDYRFKVADLDPAAHEVAVNALDQEARGTTRMADHLYFSRNATGQLYLLASEPVAYSYVWPDGRIGPLVCASQSYLVQILAYALVTLARRHRASWCTALIPGANLRISRAALRAGLRFEKHYVLATDASLGDLSTYIGCDEPLF